MCVQTHTTVNPDTNDSPQDASKRKHKHSHTNCFDVRSTLKAGGVLTRLTSNWWRMRRSTIDLRCDVEKHALCGKPQVSKQTHDNMKRLRGALTKVASVQASTWCAEHHQSMIQTWSITESNNSAMQAWVKQQTKYARYALHLDSNRIQATQGQQSYAQTPTHTSHGPKQE
jgi:hypothetical protein